MEYTQETKLSRIRFLIPLIGCIIIFGDSYTFNLPQPIETELENEMKINQVQFNTLFSIVSLPNLILPIFGGQLIDKLGYGITLIGSLILLVIGQIIVTVGVSVNLYWLMLLGRFVYGSGQETLVLTQYAIVISWFTEKELSFALGVIVAFPRLGEAMNSLITPYLAQIPGNKSILYPFFLGSILMINSLILGFIQNRVDVTHKLQKPEVSPNQEPAEKVSLKDVKFLPRTFWVIVLICGLGECLFVTFMFDVNQYYQLKYGFTNTSAGILIMIPYLLAILLTPLVARLITNIHNQSIILIIGSSIYALTFLYFFISGFCEKQCSSSVIGLILLGLCLTCFSSMFMPSVEKFVTNRAIIGTAYGIVSISQNVQLFLVPLITGEIFIQESKNSDSFDQKSIIYITNFYFILSLLLLSLSFLLFYLTRNQIKLELNNIQGVNVGIYPIDKTTDNNQYSVELEEIQYSPSQEEDSTNQSQKNKLVPHNNYPSS